MPFVPSPRVPVPRVPVPNIPNFPKRLSVRLCISDEEGPLLPSGHHLRWFVPKSLGFPSKGFAIYKINKADWDFKKKEGNLLIVTKEFGPRIGESIGIENRSKKNKIQAIGEHFDIITGIKTNLVKTPFGLYLKDTEDQHLLLHFHEPLIYFEIELDLDNVTSTGKKVKCFYKSVQIGDAALDKVVKFEQPNITDILLPLNFKQIRRVSFVKENDLIKDLENNPADFPIVRNISIPPNQQGAYDLVKSDIQAKISNYFFEGDELDKFWIKYTIKNVQELISRMKNTINNPDITVTVPAQHGMAATKVPILDYINLAALDPNIARMLGLYWVDSDMHECLYIVQANNYDHSQMRRIYGFVFSSAADEVPHIDGDVRGKQLPGISYNGNKPLGQIGLKWNRAVNSYNQSGKPVFYDLRRQIGNAEDWEWITKDKPQLANSQTPYCFREDKLPVNESITYRVTPIDIFGREGEEKDSNPIELKDLERPVPPKNVKATVLQNGFPWSIPAERREPDIKKGKIDLTLEYGEMQHQVSPDAKGLQILWKTGVKGVNNEDFNDRNTWKKHNNVLEIRPPLKGKVGFNGEIDMFKFTFKIKHIIKKAPEEMNRHIDRLDHLTTNTADEIVRQKTTRWELLIDRSLLEPHLFKGYMLSGSRQYHIIDSHAGLAFDDDKDSEHKYTARLIIEKNIDSIDLEKDEEVFVYHRRFRELKLEKIYGMIKTRDFSALEGVYTLLNVQQHIKKGQYEKVSSGEIALDYHYVTAYSGLGSSHEVTPVNYNYNVGGKLKNTFVGKVVSDVQFLPQVEGSDNDEFAQFIVRFKASDFLHLLLIRNSEKQISTEVRYYAPYVVRDIKLGLNGVNGDIKIDMPPSKRFETLWFSAYAIDNSKKQSAISVPFETRVVNPPPNVDAPVPEPCSGGNDSSKAYASPPDYNGYSTVCLTWKAVKLNGADTDIVRYELARALDKTIVAIDKQNWHRGVDSSHHADNNLEIAPGAIVTGALKPELNSNNNGTFNVKVKEHTMSIYDKLKPLEKGRIRIKHKIDGKEKYIFHKIVRVSKVLKEDAEADAEELKDIIITCRPHIELTKIDSGEIVVDDNYTAEAQPDYGDVLTDDTKLQMLANVKHSSGDLKNQHKNINSFGVVTGVPIAATQFIDKIPGRGSNRYFYKLRVVLPNEQKSEWSKCSVGFYQLDLTTADVPVLKRTMHARNKLFLIFNKPIGKGVLGLRLLKQNKQTMQLENWQSYLYLPNNSTENRLENSSIFIFNKIIDVRGSLGNKQLTRDTSSTPRLTGVFDANIDIDDSNNLFKDESQLVNNMIRLTDDMDLDGNAVVLQILNESYQTEWLSELPELVQIVISESELDGDSLYVQTIKTIEHGDNQISLDSGPIEVLAMHEELSNGY